MGRCGESCPQSHIRNLFDQIVAVAHVGGHLGAAMAAEHRNGFVGNHDSAGHVCICRIGELVGFAAVECDRKCHAGGLVAPEAVG